jgi:putative endonuclease
MPASRKAAHAASAWIVYILRCGDGSLYAGITNDLARRLAAHRAGTASRYTRTHLPVRLVYQEPAAGRPAALRREAAIKRLTRDEKLFLIRPARRTAAAPARAKRTGRRTGSGSNRNSR